ncbi:MAG: signal recognition particle-docking protein FtsY [Fusobacteriaceae bacterium]
MGFLSKIFGKKNKNEEVESDKHLKELQKAELTQEEIKKIENEVKAGIKEDEENFEEYILDRGVVAEKKNEEQAKKKTFFNSLKDKLFNSRQGFFKSIKNFFTGRTVVNDEMYEELEELLVQSDIGLEMTIKIIEELENEVKKRGIKNPEAVYPVLKEVMEGFIISTGTTLEIKENKMNVILVVGVNGVGKTTTIGKLASKYTKLGKKVVIGAGDTFRAAAVEQIEEWAKRAGAELVKPQKEGADPGAVVFDTLKIAEEKGADIVIIDTAGRLHNKNNLMAELEKINNIIKKKIGENSYESLLVIDGTTGQNGLAQAKVFNEVTELTGFVITKLDGTAKGGILFSVSEAIKKPIKFIGVGEGIEDLREFNLKEYIEAIFE